MSLAVNEDKMAYLARKKEEALEKTASSAVVSPQRFISSFLSLSDLNLPDNMYEIFQWCKYFFMFDPLIHGAINALATFPVTQITLEESEWWVEKRKKATKEEEEVLKKDSEFLTSVRYQLFQKTKIYKLLVEIGIDYFLYGNCFILGEFKKNSVGEMEWSNIRRISPGAIIIDRYPDGSVKYKWRVPDTIKKIIQDKAPKDAFDKIPSIFIEAVRQNKSVVIDNDKLYHFSKPSDSLYETSWGMPGISNVLKLLMYRTTLRQAQEAIAKEHIVPLRIFYLNPQGGISPGAIAGSYGAGGAIIESPNQVLAKEIAKTSVDPNYKVVSSTPIGMITAGGHGRGLLLTPEIDQIQSEILAGMNVPREFIFGGVSYSGSSVSLKILENHFITYRLQYDDFINNFLIKGLAKARGIWKNEDDNYRLVVASMGELKMQDDIQQKQMAINLNAAGKVSNDYLLRAFGINSSKESAKILEETIEKANLERVIMIEQVKTQAIIEKMTAVEQVRTQEFMRKLNIYVQEVGVDTLNREDIEKIVDAIELKFPTKALETYEMNDAVNKEQDVVKKQGEFMELADAIVGEAIRDHDLAEQILLANEADIKDVKRFHSLLTDIQFQLGEEFKTAQTESQIDNLSEFMAVVDSLMVQYTRSLNELQQQEMAAMGMDPSMMTQDPNAMAQNPNAMVQDPNAMTQDPNAAQGTATPGVNAGAAGEGIDMRPMPSQLPPRRNTLG